MTQSTIWHEQLTRVSAEGDIVVAASMRDRDEVVGLLREMLARSSLAESAICGSALYAWADNILSSKLWLVLMLKNACGTACGIAVCEYISYEVDINSRVLRCKHFHVRTRATGSLYAPATLLLDALMEAASRSPKLRDVFIVSTGATEHQRLRPMLQRLGYRRIGTQHIGFGRGLFGQDCCALEEISSITSLGPEEHTQLRIIADAFFAESGRAALGPVSINFDRLLAYALGSGDHTATTFLARIDGEIVGFITGREGTLPLSSRRYLKSDFFYVKPHIRGSALPLRLFDAFGARALALGLDGALLGTSSAIATDRVCRLLELRGFQHCGDVLAARVVRGR